MKIMVVGTGGYIGGCFKKYMSEHHPDVEISEVSSRNKAWENVSFEGFDAVYNVSGLAHANARHGSEEDYYAVNGRLPVEVAEKARREGVGLFIQMSSMIVYGDMSRVGQPKMIGPDTVPSEPTIYGKSKMMAERGLQALATDSFKVAIIRPPLIYSEFAKDNFPRLVKFAKTSPIFPLLDNSQSMIYVDNLMELVYLIAKSGKGGIYYPQQPEYIHTSKIVSDIAEGTGRKILLTRVFNPILRLLARKIGFINKAFGNITYRRDMSAHFNWDYIVVSYPESVRRIAEYTP